MACVKTDNSPNGLRNNFERVISHLLPYDPVAKKRATGIKRGSALISLTEAHEGPLQQTTLNQALVKRGYTYITTSTTNT